MIPAIAHFIWLEEGSLPLPVQTNIEVFRRLHPDWEVRVWREIPEDCWKTLDAALAMVSSQEARSCLLGWWILHSTGGFLIDVRVQALRSFHPLQDRNHFGAMKNGGVSDCIFGSVPGSQITSYAIATILRLTRDTNDLEPSLGETLLNFMRRNPLLRFHLVPPHYFCLFRNPASAFNFLSGTEAARTRRLASLLNLISDNVAPFGVHCWDLGYVPSQTGTGRRPKPFRLKARADLITQPSPELAEEEVVEPGLLEKASNFGKAMGRLGMKLLRGEKISVTREERERRLSICRGTDLTPKCKYFDSKKVACKKCGCYSTFKNKLATEHCPIGKW